MNPWTIIGWIVVVAGAAGLLLALCSGAIGISAYLMRLAAWRLSRRVPPQPGQLWASMTDPGYLRSVVDVGPDRVVVQSGFSSRTYMTLGQWQRWIDDERAALAEGPRR